MLKNEQKFYSALEDVFIGEAGKKIEGKSGFVNLMKIKSQYFANIRPFIQKEINENISEEEEREELYQKLYTFFESYLNETGTPFFSKTPFHKNLYERVYSEKEDVTLFWKTQKLYYVKSEATYHSIQNMELDDIVFDFDASNIEHQKSNEKKELEFYLTDATQDKLTFKVVYVDNSRSKYDRLKDYLDQNTPDKVRKYIADNFEELNHSNIIKQGNNLNREGLKTKTLQDALLLNNNDDSVNSVTIEFAISKLDDMLEYAKVNNLHKVTEEVLKKAFSKYKKQNEVDYFIHKDAEGFLKEQFDLFIYDYLFNEKSLYNEWITERISHIQKLKEIAYSVIEYIAKFEDELKAIWNKPKFVRNTNYVFTLDKIADNPELIKKLIEHKGWLKQVEEWRELSQEWIDENGEILKKEWPSFVRAANISKKDILKGDKLNHKFKSLPIDTKHFADLKYVILNSFAYLDMEIDGVLIKSDNYQALITIQSKYNNCINSVYIDPPFNLGTNADFLYKVNYKDSTWSTILENRLELSKKLIHSSGSQFVRCDYNGNALVRLILNNVFGENNFRNEINVNRGKQRFGGMGKYSVATDSLYFYAKSEEQYFSPFKRERYADEAKGTNMLMKGERKPPERVFIDPKGNKVTLLPPKGTHWKFVQKKIDEMYRKNLIYLAKSQKGMESGIVKLENGEKFKVDYVPSFKFDDDKTIDSNWTDIAGYSADWSFLTENSEQLLYRVILSSSQKKDIVMDYFCGSGTTIAVAHKTKRKWIGIEQDNQFYNVILPRLKHVLLYDPSGISKDKEVIEDYNQDTSCGFFKYYELEQYEDALARAKYNPKEDDISNINFTKDEKLLDAMIIDNEKEEIKMHFELLYPDVDIAETMSNVTGKKIKKLNKERVIFEDGTEIKFDEMNYSDPHFKDAYKKLLWWKSKE